LKPVVQPIQYSGFSQKINEKTVKDFKLTSQDIAETNGTKLHKFNHVQQNIKLAANIREYKSIQHSFKKSVLAKNNN
jgi:DNA topoisomerase VI subunit A